jgi:hypothetical protein
MHPGHDIELGDHIERHVRAVIAIPKGSKIKVLEQKTVTMGPLRGRADAEDVVHAAARLYRERIASPRGGAARAV